MCRSCSLRTRSSPPRRRRTPCRCTHSLPSAIPFPFRPFRFLRLYPSAFALSPHPIEVSPTPRLSALHAAEAQVVDATCPDSADRLLRLLMLAPSRALPLRLVARLRLGLGLAPDFQRSLMLVLVYLCLGLHEHAGNIENTDVQTTSVSGRNLIEYGTCLS